MSFLYVVEYGTSLVGCALSLALRVCVRAYARRSRYPVAQCFRADKSSRQRKRTPIRGRARRLQGPEARSLPISACNEHNPFKPDKGGSLSLSLRPQEASSAFSRVSHRASHGPSASPEADLPGVAWHFFLSCVHPPRLLLVGESCSGAQRAAERDRIPYNSGKFRLRCCGHARTISHLYP